MITIAQPKHISDELKILILFLEEENILSTDSHLKTLQLPYSGTNNVDLKHMELTLKYSDTNTVDPLNQMEEQFDQCLHFLSACFTGITRQNKWFPYNLRC